MSQPTLSPEELQALMEAVEDGRVNGNKPPPQGATVNTYDLTGRDRISRGQMPTLDALNEQIASMFGTGLGGRIRMSIKILSSPSTLQKFADVQALLAPPATVGVLSLGKGFGQGLLILEPKLADALLAKALGDRTPREEEPNEARRELTSIERLVLKRLLTLFTEAMGSAWSSVIPLAPEVLRFEGDPRMAMIAPPSETAIVCAFDFIDGVKGRLQLAFPFAAIEGEKKALLSAPPVSVGAADVRFTQAMARGLEQTPVCLRVILGRTTLQLSRLLELEMGHVLGLNTDDHSQLEVLVEDRPKLAGTPTVSGANLSIVVTRDLRGAGKDNSRASLPTRDFTPDAA